MTFWADEFELRDVVAAELRAAGHQVRVEAKIPGGQVDIAVHRPGQPDELIEVKVGRGSHRGIQQLFRYRDAWPTPNPDLTLLVPTDGATDRLRVACEQAGIRLWIYEPAAGQPAAPVTQPNLEPFMPLDELRVVVAASRAAQGLPPTITDRPTLAKAAVLILTHRAARARFGMGEAGAQPDVQRRAGGAAAAVGPATPSQSRRAS